MQILKQIVDQCKNKSVKSVWFLGQLTIEGDIVIPDLSIERNDRCMALYR